MARLKYAAVNHQGIPDQRVRSENLATAPTPDGIGHRYFDTALGYERVWTGSAWLDDASIAYVDQRVSGQDWKASVRAASTADVAVASALVNGLVMDGLTLATGDRVFLKNQTTASQNGIYVVVASGAASRSTDADNSGLASEVTAGMTIPVEGGGTGFGGTIWLLTTAGAITLGTTALTFSQIGAGGAAYTASTGLTLTGNAFSLTNPVAVGLGGTGGATAAAARTSLGVVAYQKFSALNGALSAGVEATIAHGLTIANADALVQVRDATTGAEVTIDNRIDATNVYLTSAVAVGASALRVTVLA